MAQWQEIKRNLEDWGRTAANRTSEAARIGVRRFDAMSLNRQRRGLLRDLGQYVLDQVDREQPVAPDDPQLVSLVAAIREVDEALNAKQSEIDEIKVQAREDRAKTAAPAATEPENTSAAEPVDAAAATDAEMPPEADTATEGAEKGPGLGRQGEENS
jgi:hypothetical protein